MSSRSGPAWRHAYELRVTNVRFAVASQTTCTSVHRTPTTLHRSIAESVRTARARAGYTLDQLAARSGLSKAYLSRLESGERNPSVATLLSLSRVLGVPMSVLLGEGAATEAPIAIHDGNQFSCDVNGLTVASLSGFGGSRALDAVKITIAADRTPPPFVCHRGEEWVYVLSGVLRLEHDGGTHVVFPAQAAHFDADRPHRLGAHGQATEVLLVAAAIPGDEHRAHHYGPTKRPLTVPK